ncbi:hypothetical protein HI914_04473 [Erysiphe necator]|nr:hypothetical protein HI914_04473 [Erysiphe necator]
MSFEIPSGWIPSVTESKDNKVFTYKAKDFDLKNNNTLKQKILNAYILEKLQFYKITENKDARLWEYFTEHFDGWSSTLFHIVSLEVRGELRDHLKFRGVFVNNSKRIDYALHDTLCETEQHE